jgi:uncharacterized membrane protein YdbT with pleckstrin-like domain
VKKGKRFKDEGLGWRKTLFTPVASFLEEGEKILYETGSHPAAAAPLAVAAVLLAAPTYCVSLLFLIPSILKMKTSRFIVTDRRVLARHGFIRPRLVRIPLEEIIEASVGEGPLDAKFGMGRIVLRKKRETFLFNEIRDPDAFLSQMISVKETA